MIKGELCILVRWCGVDQDKFVDRALAAASADRDLTEIGGGTDEAGRIGGREAERDVEGNVADVVEADRRLRVRRR